MGSQWGKDSAYLRAMKEGYRSRAAFKLKDIQDRYRIIRDDDNVVDLGAAPGSWLQVERGFTHGKVLGIDLNPIPPLDGVETMVADMSDPELLEKVRKMLGIVNVVVSDAAPKLSGHKSYDQARAVELGEIALEFACKVLKPGGNFVVKSFQGQDFSGLLDRVKDHFLSVKGYRTKTSRKGSAEVYIVAKYFVGAGNEA
jgi:23S rRNA (uridine2552-2'-O)-methyltransferase